MNQVVIRYQDGRTLKGWTHDFLPHHAQFHVTPEGAAANDKPLPVRLDGLKAVFFVKTLQGDRRRRKQNVRPAGPPLPGQKMRVTFKDGEVMVGATQAYHPDRSGFFLTPVDPGSNNERCFIVAAATKEVRAA